MVVVRGVTMIMDVDLLLGVGGMVGLWEGIVGLFLLPLSISVLVSYRTWTYI